jgi:hypothetical protein
MRAVVAINYLLIDGGPKSYARMARHTLVHPIRHGQNTLAEPVAHGAVAGGGWGAGEVV